MSRKTDNFKWRNSTNSMSSFSLLHTLSVFTTDYNCRPINEGVQYDIAVNKVICTTDSKCIERVVQAVRGIIRFQNRMEWYLW